MRKKIIKDINIKSSYMFLCKKVISFLLPVIILLLSSLCVYADERSIYVGDIIQIKVSTNEYSVEDIQNKFKDFEIVNIEDKVDGYIVAIRTFDTGKKKIQLGDKEILIDIKSTLNDIERNNVYEGDLEVEKPSNLIEWKYVLYSLIIIFIITGTISLFRLIKYRKDSSLSPFQKFIKQIDDISEDDEEYLVKLTFYFKEYIELCFSCKILGKTSTEIINQIKSISELKLILPEIKIWLEQCDRFKFSGIHVSKHDKIESREKLIELIKKYELTKEGEK